MLKAFKRNVRIINVYKKVKDRNSNKQVYNLALLCL